MRTKLFVPPPRPNLVSRPRLIERLNEGLQGKLTLVSAPAGFGKTTLVSEWVHGKDEGGGMKDEWGSIRPSRVAWLSLDEGDSDPSRFLAYFIAALQTIEAGIGEGALAMLQSGQAASRESVLTTLLNDIATVPEPFVVVIDDYQAIDSPAIDDALTFALEHQPPQMHLTITTREDPNIPLAQLRARGELTELRAAELRFSNSEAAAFLNQVMGLDLSVADVRALESRTEGWIAGLQLAAISMQGRADRTTLIESFTGSHRFVLDYLIEEVLEVQSESTQTFLLQTAILDRLTGPLCDAVRFGLSKAPGNVEGTALTGQDNGQQTLEYLERANLFIVPLDHERRWYRYHRLFSELLHRRLQNRRPDLIPTLHARASAWYAEHGFIDQAIDHALAGESFDQALRLLEGEAEALWGRDEPVKLRRWLDKLPAEMVRSKPQLCIVHAWSCFVTGEQEAAGQCLDAAEEALGASAAEVAASLQPGGERPVDGERMKLLGRIAATRSFLAFFQNDIPAIINYSRLALDLLPAGDLTWRSSAAISLGDAYSLAGQADAAYAARLEAVAECQRAGNVYMQLIAGLKLATTLRQKGHLSRTIETCQQHIRLAEENDMSNSATNGCLYAIWGEALAELNDLDGALEMANKGIPLTERGGDVASLGWSYLCLMRILLSAGDISGAEAIIRKTMLADQKLSLPPWFTEQMAAWQARVHLARNEVETGAEHLARYELAAGSDISFQHETGYLVLAKIRMAQGRHEEAGSILQQLLIAAEEGGRTSRAIAALIQQSLAFQAQRETDLALGKLERALALAEPGGFIRSFLDEGPSMVRLLHEAVDRGIAPEYAGRLLAASRADEPAQDGTAAASADQSEMVEPLSERELEVMQLIAQGLTNREIGDRLYLSLHTVKVHARNIYAKLDVHSRTQAIARAQELELLSGRSI